MKPPLSGVAVTTTRGLYVNIMARDADSILNMRVYMCPKIITRYKGSSFRFLSFKGP